LEAHPLPALADDERELRDWDSPADIDVMR
jgi:hypothetical protein